MNEQKLIKVLKQLTALANLQDEKNDSIDLRLDNLQKQINLLVWRVENEAERIT
jgi:flagellar capping protein FliD